MIVRDFYFTDSIDRFANFSKGLQKLFKEIEDSSVTNKKAVVRCYFKPYRVNIKWFEPKVFFFLEYYQKKKDKTNMYKCFIKF